MKPINAPIPNPQKLFNGFLVQGSRVLWALGRYAFLVLLVLIVLSILYGQLLFYRYAFLANTLADQPSITIATFKENVYTSILVEQAKREEALQDALQEIYSNPFQ